MDTLYVPAGSSGIFNIPNSSVAPMILSASSPDSDFLVPLRCAEPPDCVVVEPAVPPCFAAIEPLVEEPFGFAAVESAVEEPFGFAAVESAVEEPFGFAAVELAVEEPFGFAAVEPAVGEPFGFAANGLAEEPFGFAAVAPAVEEPFGFAAVEPAIEEPLCFAALEPAVEELSNGLSAGGPLCLLSKGPSEFASPAFPVVLCFSAPAVDAVE